MSTALIRWCLRNVFLVLLALVAIVAGGILVLDRVPVDAIPDIGEKQVIVFADWPGRSPQDVDDQVTYPLTTALTGTPGVKTIRSMSGFGFSMVFVIFNDETDYYWARSRVLERMNVAQARLPAGVSPVLGPDATALGQIYWYTVEGEGFDLAELRSIQDWYVRYQLNSVEGVSEVASVGGFVKQYQIDLHPDKLRAHGVTLMEVYEAVRRSNIDVGAKVLEKNGVEFFLRGVGFVKGAEDLENIALRQSGGTPLLVKNVATVTLGPDFRRGALDKGGAEAVGGVVTMRYGENPLAVMERVKKKLTQLEPGLPRKTLSDGRVSQVRIVPFYDRTTIVHETIDTLRTALAEEMLVGTLIILIFLLHLRSAVAVVVTLPLSLAACFILMWAFGVDANIMSLAGLAIAIGDVADMGIIMTENVYRRIASRPAGKGHFETVFEGASEVGGAILTAVSNTVVSFIPVFFLTDQEGKLFRPLAFTKTFAIGSSAVLAVTIVPVLCLLLFRTGRLSGRSVNLLSVGLGLVAAAAVHFALDAGWMPTVVTGVIVGLCVLRMGRERFRPMDENPVSRLITRCYRPTLAWVLDHKRLFLLVPLLILGGGLFTALQLGWEFMPPLDEGSFLYMPSLLPHAGLSEAVKINAQQDVAIASVPEVASVVGKLGRAETALDPAPIGMFETIINLKPESEWRTVPIRRRFSDWPSWLKAPLTWVWPEERRITKSEILEELRQKTAIPGVLPTWLQPIQTRLVMLQTGFRAMMGVKVYGSDLREIERIALQMEGIFKEVPGATDIVAERIVGKPYLEFVIDRERLARYGVSVRDVQDAIEMGIGGENLTEAIEGRERYPIRVRYLRDYREDLPALEKILVATSSGAQVPLAQVVEIRSVVGPQEIKGEKGLLVGYVTLNTTPDHDEMGVVESAERALQAALKEGRLRLPPGYYWEWGGQFESLQRAMKTLWIVIPATLVIMFVMLYLGFSRWWVALIIFFGVAVSASGAFVFLAIWGVNLSVAVIVGFLVLFGVVDDDGVVMSKYLEQRFEGAKFGSIREIREAVIDAGLKRIRPCLMTTATTVVGLMPVFWATGRGSDVMQPMALPCVGGMAVQLITLFIVPCLFSAVEEWRWRKKASSHEPQASS